MLDSDILHEIHDQQIVIDRYIGLFKYRRALVLAGRYFVMAGYDRDSKFERFQLERFHEILYSHRDGGEIMIVHLLTLGGLSAKDGPAKKQKVWPSIQEFLINQEVLLLPPKS